MRDNGSNVHLTWQGMAGVYEAPEAGTLLGLMQPVSSQATTAGDNLETVSGALKQFAADVRPIKTELDSLRLQAEAFGTEIAGGVSVRELNPAYISAQGYSGSWASYGAASTATQQDIPQYRSVTKEWHEVQDYVDRNNDLIAQVNAQQVALWDAERTAANKIRALYGASPLHAYESENDPLGYGLSEIPEGTDMPWGAAVERSEGCGEATLNFVVKDFLWEGLIVGGIWGTVEGLGTLVLGYNPATGDWFSGDAYGAAWGSLGLLVASGVMNSAVLGPLLWADQGMAAFGGGGFLPQEVRDFKAKADEAALNTGKALIAWDQWADDPGTALGESVFNVGTILIPAGAAITGVKTAGTAASVLSKMARVVDLIDPASLALNGAVRVGGLGLGSLDNIIGSLDLGAKLDPPHIEVYAATDSASAIRAMDDWGVDLNSVTARVDDLGTPVLEAPGIRIELPAGSFDTALGGVRAGDGGMDASVTAPVREPELVHAGGVRGETGPGPVNSIVDEAPARTETGGSGESTLVREPDTTTGGGAESGAGGGSGDFDGAAGSSDDAAGPNLAGGDGGSGSGSDDGGASGASAGDGAPSMDAQIARLDGSAPVLDTTGRDISTPLRATTMAPDELAAYLYASDEAAFHDFIATGEWPADIQIPKSIDVLDVGVDDTFGVDWSEVPQRGYVLDAAGDAVRVPHVPATGSVIDRYGPPNGTFTSPVPDSGPYVYDQRSLPYVEDPGHYHQYEVVGDLGDLRPYYDAAPARVQQLVDRAVERGYFTWNTSPMQGEIAPGFGSAGGGQQIELPLPVSLLEALGLLKEITP